MPDIKKIKLKDFLSVVFEQGNIRSDDIAATLGASALAEIEIPEEVQTKFNEIYLTRERAENDPTIIQKLGGKSKADTLDAIDVKIQKFLALLPKEKSDEIKAVKNSFDKLDQVKDAVNELLKGTKNKTEQDIAKVQEDWAAKYEALKEQAKSEKSILEKQYRDDKINFVLKNKIMGYDFAEAFADQKIKSTLIDTFISQVKQAQENGNSVILDLDPTGNMNVRQEKDGALIDIYRNGNEKLTIEKLIQPIVDPFLKKSNGKQDQDNTKPKPVAAPQLSNNPTLREMMIAKAAEA